MVALVKYVTVGFLNDGKFLGYQILQVWKTKRVT